MPRVGVTIPLARFLSLFEAFSQLVLQYLTACITGQLGHEVDDLRYLVARDFAFAKLDDVLVLKLVSIARDHDYGDSLSPDRMGHADGGALPHRRMVVYDPLDLKG